MQGAADLVQAILRASGSDAEWYAPDADHPAIAWRCCGLHAITGVADGPALVCPVAVTTFADYALDALRVTSDAASLPLSGAVLMGERARLLDLPRRGDTSPNGSCHLIEARDGRIAINLPREDDLDLAGAMVGEGISDLAGLAHQVRQMSCADLVERGRTLGLAIAVDTMPKAAQDPIFIRRDGSPLPAKPRPLVVDFSSLWAGPLAGSLLAACGADVIKVESRSRPDGARFGDARFFDLLNAGKRCAAFDFASEPDRALLRRLVSRADIVIEASRPRALRALGLDAEAEVARGATWLSITGHGRDGAAGDAIAFGDDAGIAGGLGAAMREVFGQSLFAGDAIADPLSGIAGALAAWSAHRAGGGALIDLSMSGLVAALTAHCRVGQAEGRAWQQMALADTSPLYPMRQASGRAAALGADHEAIIAELADS